MKVEDVLAHYRTAYNFSKVSKMSINNIYNWRNMGYIPIVSQIRLEVISEGALKADINHTVKNAHR